ncbi:STAS domain-containing protein [Streptomyces sp. NP160]|uniref:STAS domain-containing protein n=1 Tax=Streptomyces sp. NP160 TaxID=2586637 RepID=UPI001117E631|nr:STAS domain-containing protein [Streptomyces sp. NP160]TNM70246.1 STAS domain-containing protein [Streptomyces sp. NP160]
MSCSPTRAPEQHARATSALDVSVEVRPRARGTRALCVMTLVGDLDIYSAPRLRSATDRALPLPDGPDGPDGVRARTDVVVDLAAVPFVDSSGLGALLLTLRRTTALGGRLAVVGASEQVSRLFTVTGVSRIVSLHATLADVVTARTTTA